MPTYDYECSKCKNIFEVFQRMSDKPVSKCPKCGGRSERHIAAGSGVIFKGTGFYETDYKRKPSPKDNTSSCGGSDACKGCPKSSKK